MVVGDLKHEATVPSQWADLAAVPARTTLGGMTDRGPTSRVRLDDKRRTTFPTPLLAAAGVGPGADLVARVEGPGRIVLETSASVVARMQEMVRAAKAERGVTGSLADELLAERAADTSLDLPTPTSDTEASPADELGEADAADETPPTEAPTSAVATGADRPQR
jgi:bifunctional DNA-binding transcriptional regulator/antitoxin component of YhaV-PrlF toxin-antitoxin module